MLNVATVSSYINGGAGKAAYRLHLGLLNNNVNSYFLQKELIEQNANGVYRIPFIKNNLLLRALGKLKLYESPENKAWGILKKYPKNWEFTSLPFSNYRIEDSEYLIKSDIVHLHWVSGFLNYSTFFKNVKKPIVWTLHDMNPIQGLFHYKEDEIYNPDIMKIINPRLYETKLNAIHHNKNIHVVCLSKWLMKASLNSEILGHYPHYLIPNGLNIDAYELINKEKLKEKFNIRNNNKTFLFVSNDIHVRRKGFDILLNSINTIKDKAFNLITVGGKKIELPSNIIHLHYDHINNQKELNEIYSVADMFLLCSREDNLPNVMLESFANGTPVMSFRVGGMNDWIIHKKNGILIDKIDPILLRIEICKFIDGHYQFDSNFIRKYASENFNQSSQINSYIDLYNKLL